MDLSQITEVTMLKSKIIAIVYQPNAIGSVSKAEKMFRDIFSEMEEEGKEVRNSADNYVAFEDGSKIFKVKMGEALIGRRVTHLYVENSIKNVENGEEFVNVALKPFVISQGDYANIDASDSVNDRIKYF